MSLLAIDVGNTHTVLGLFDGERLGESWRVATDAKRSADELALLVRGLLADSAQVSGIAVASGVPAVLHELRVMCGRYYPGAPLVVVEPGTRTGVPILTDNPREVGADRIVNALAAYHLYGGPAVVVDFGTSTNLDVVSARGEFLGGVIAPGIEISLDAMAARGAQLFKVELLRPRSVIGKSTVECLQAGIIYGVAGQVDGLVRRILAELPGDVSVIATGGLAGLVLAECATVRYHEPDLTLRGLQLIYAKNAS